MIKFHHFFKAAKMINFIIFQCSKNDKNFIIFAFLSRVLSSRDQLSCLLFIFLFFYGSIEMRAA